MARYARALVGVLTLSIAYFVFRAAYDVPRLISPQGCRMSWMSPSYILQSEFNTSWTSLARRYTLLLYREVGWEPNQAMGVPVLFIPGNAGSSHQVRSIASSAARQYFSSPFTVSEEFTGRGAKPIDFYAVEFNEDLSAFHGITLDSQIDYTSAAVKYILSRYPHHTQIIIVGHSMGGIVGAALLPSDDIAALITMSTPHTLPPARFDPQIEQIYYRSRRALREAETPILSICGGATDMMIPSESCILPPNLGPPGVYRRTVFTSALEGAWTGVGHREMVWCHQVRWQIARAALELGTVPTVTERTRVLDRWLRDGSILPQVGDSVRYLSFERGEYEVLSAEARLVLNGPLGKRTYLLPVPSAEDEDEGHRRTFVLYVSQGSVLNVSPYRALDLRVSVYHCMRQSTEGTVSCDSLEPTALKLLPAPIPGKSFPVPDEGVDESEGLVFFEAELPRKVEGWVGVTVDAGDDGRGWVAGGFDRERHVKSELNLWDLALGGVKISLPRPDNGGWKTSVSFPRLPAHALLVYRLVPKVTEYSSCAAPLFPPLLVQTSQTFEIHYYHLTSDQPVFLHTHSSAPYVPPPLPTSSYGVNLMIHAAGPSCQDVTDVVLSVDWWASVGRMGTRFPTTLLSWSIGIVSLLLFYFWSLDGQRLSVHESLDVFVRRRMPPLMVVAGVVALFPWGPDYYLGVGDELGVFRALLAVILVGMAVGMVCISWWVLVVFMSPLRGFARGSVQRKPEDGNVRRGAIISMTLLVSLVCLFVPWQVTFLACWVIQFFNCNIARPKPYPGSAPTLASTPTSEEADKTRDESDSLAVDCMSLTAYSQSPDTLDQAFKKGTFSNAHDQNAHVLLLMTWLLPFAAPVLVVWVRTLQTAGYTMFGGYREASRAILALTLVDLLGRGRPLNMTGAWRLPVRLGWIVVAAIAFVMGGRRTEVVYAAATIQMSVVWFSSQPLSFRVSRD